MARTGTMGKLRFRTSSTRHAPAPLISLLIISAIMCSSWWLVGRRIPLRLLSPYATKGIHGDVNRLPTVTGLLVNSSACRLPDYDPWDTSVAQLIRADRRFAGCRRHFPVRLTQKGRLLKMSVEDGATCDIRCCYRSVKRKDEGSSDDHYQFGDSRICFGDDGELLVNDEFIRVRCFCKDRLTIVYEDFRAFIVSKPNITYTPKQDVKRGEKLNVYLLGLDSVSRLQFKRYLPDVESILAIDYTAIPMGGLTKVGINTFPNMLAFLAGKKLEEIKSLRDKPFDDLPIVWKDFSRLGYVTMFNEDTPDEGTFNYVKKGFFVSPTDFYMRPFFRSIEDSGFVQSKATLCVNQRAQLDLQLQWLEDLMTTEVTTAPQFALLFSSSLSHNGPLPYVEALQERLTDFLLWYRNSPRYNSSVMMFFSDHGMRFGEIMRYELGGYESRLPFFYILLPPWYADRYPKRVAALKTNSRRLTTFFDVHATLRDLLRDSGAVEADLPKFRHPGVSLFQEVPEERSCEDAGIAPHWCVCGVRQPVPLDDDVITRAAAAAVRHINTVLLKGLQVLCAELKLVRVTAALHSRTQRGKKLRGKKVVLVPFEEYAVKFVTKPGLAEFEALVRVELTETESSEGTGSPREKTEERGEMVGGWPKTAEERAKSAVEEAEQNSAWHGGGVTEYRLTVLDVSRLNLYRGQSNCLLSLWDERRFCYCRDLL